ncbi:MAG: enoyl-CoA hydratase [Rhizobiales bacterium]|nr:enoyl-CoA hydratase [Hyphomicrobiales bacterium]
MTTEPSTAGEAELLYDVSDGVATVSFNRPAARNAITFGMYAELSQICETVGGADGVKALIVRGEGEHAFAAGTDISQFRAFSGPEDGLAYEAEMDRVLNTIEDCGVPTIAAMHGACTGGGAAIAASCDIRIAAADLKFGFPIARTLGNCLSATSLSRLVQLIGAGRTKEILFTSRLIRADEAQATGLVSEILPTQDALNARAVELAQVLSGHAPLTLKATKQALARLRKTMAAIDDEDLIALCYTSEDFREGLEAFLAKRKPQWQGR